MKKEKIKINQLFKTHTALKVLPDEITVWHDLRLKKAKVDIIINTFNKPELTNQTALNYSLLEDKIPVNIIIVESSGNKNIYQQIKSGNAISKILVEDHKASHPGHGAGSYGMAISAAIGFYFSKSPYVFFSHNDMLALKKDFLKELLIKLNDTTRIASFTQRHVIPFTGCMLVDRKVIEESKTDWLLYDDNPYIEKSEFIQKLCKLRLKSAKLKCNWIDAGEALIYEEIANKKKVYISPSFGGTKGLWKTSFDLIGISSSDVQKAGDFIEYGTLNIDKKTFKKKYQYVLKAGKEWENLQWFLSRRKNYWRYTVDENGELIFIHHGRGVRRTINRWLKFIKELNKKLSYDNIT